MNHQHQKQVVIAWTANGPETYADTVMCWCGYRWQWRGELGDWRPVELAEPTPTNGDTKHD